MTPFQGDHAALAALATEQQCNRLLRLRFPRNNEPASGILLANSLRASEELGRDFRFTIEVLSDCATVDFDEVMGKMVTIELVREDGTLRFFNGYIFEFRFVKTDGGFAFYEMILAPWLAFLKLRHDNATFQNMNVKQITEEIFEQYLKRDWRHRIAGDEKVITYSCQYNESDHNFLHRHWQAHGWSYHYEHRADGHTLVLSDDTRRTATPIVGACSAMPFQHMAGTSEDDGIHHWCPRQRVGSDKINLASFNFKHPRPKRAEYASVSGNSSDPALEIYENLGAYGFTDFPDGIELAQLRIEEQDAIRQQCFGTGNDRTAEPGRWFTLSNHFGQQFCGVAPDTEPKYLIVSVKHEATNNYQDGRGALSKYQNELECLPHHLPWRPGRNHNSVAQKIFGVQTATVVGPQGEEIHTDEYGRVKVQFHWDRKGKFDEKSSAWVRVVSTWAGRQFGHISLPRIGMEVAIQFLDGNPDRPIVIGCVYNANNMPPWALPQNKTQSGMLTRSSTNANATNANALRFEDKRGEEEVWLHAEKNQRLEVEHDESHWVGNDRRKIIDRDETVEVKRDRSEIVGHNETINVRNDRCEHVGRSEAISIGGDRTERVGGNENIHIQKNKQESVVMAKTETIGMANMLTIGGLFQTTVGGAMNSTVAMASSEQVGLHKSVTVGKQFVLEANFQISLNVGSSRITITPDAIYLEATTIHLLGEKNIHADASGDIFLNSGTAQTGPEANITNDGGEFEIESDKQIDTDTTEAPHATTNDDVGF